MKRLIACVLVLVLGLSVFAGCDKEPAEDAQQSNPLKEARDYVYNTYKNASEAYIADYKVIGQVLVGDKTYTVTWTTDAAEENVKIVVGDDKMVTIDINEKNPEEVSYTLTAAIKDEAGTTETVTFKRRTPGAVIIDEGMSYEQIVEAGYKLPVGIAMEETLRLFGTITKIDTAWSDQYKNITVTIQVGDMADKPIMCYRLAGDGADKLAVGDKITVEGVLKNYNGTIEFDAGCKLLGVGLEIKNQKPILEAAYKLEAGMSMTEPTTLVGVISKIDTPWSDQYKNITVTIICDDDAEHPMMCYRLAGEGADKLAVGDKIQVTGTIKNYNGTIEFDAACTLDAVVKAEAPEGGDTTEPAKPVEAPSKPSEIVEAAYKLADGEALPYTATLAGKIVSVDNAYSDQYKNITVTIQIGDMADKLIQCYRLKGEGADKLAVGDQIVVTGTISNYKGAVQFGSSSTFIVAPTDAAEIVNAGYALEDGKALPYTSTLTGKITSIDDAYSDQYKNITVTIQIGDMADKLIQCYRLKGEGADKLAVGDTITVTGTINTYKGKVQFGSGSTFVK